MKVVLAGKSRYALGMKTALTDAGIEPCPAETVAELKALPEELPVVLLYDTKLSPLVTDKKALGRAVLGLKPQDTIVFLMDKDVEASPQVEGVVIDMATYLASVKRSAAVLMRSSRAPDKTFDDRYMLARQKGVTFIRYDSLEVKDNDGIYTLAAFDGKMSVSLETKLCIDCSEQDSPELDEFIGALRLRTYGDECISGNRWFLNEGTTYKRNVKLINTLALGGDIDQIVPALVRDLEALATPGQGKTAFVDIKKCAFCYTCYRVCPHTALKPDETAAAMKVNDLLCSACGICVAVCPASAIEFRGEAVSVAKSADTKNKLKVFCCENSAFIASKDALAGMEATVEAVPCGGDISSVMMTEALKAYDNVLVAVCYDDACKHFDGNKRVIKQVERLKERLDKLGYDPKRLSCVQTGITMVGILRDAAEKAMSGGGEK